MGSEKLGKRLRKFYLNIKLNQKHGSFYLILFIIFIFIFFLDYFGVYNMNNEIINSFTIGTFLLTISDLNENNLVKDVIFLLGMFSIIALPNCDEILSLITDFISQENILLISLALVFFSLFINEIKYFKNEDQKKKLNDQEKKLVNRTNTIKQNIEIISILSNEVFTGLISFSDVLEKISIEDKSLFEKLINNPDITIDEIKEELRISAENKSSMIESATRSKNSITDSKNTMLNAVEKMKKNVENL